jgi:RNA polymerase sigma-70 factor, ECF subfamily
VREETQRVDKEWEAWLDNYGDRLFRLSLRLCNGCHADAEDLVQEALIAAFQSRPKFSGRAKQSTYVHAITLNCWRKRLRRKLSFTPLTGNEISDSYGSSLAKLTLDAALETLTIDQREAFVLVKSEGLTYKEAAAILKIPQGTIQSRVFDATQRLRLFLTEENETHDPRSN